MMKPIVNLNGTSKEALLEQYVDAMNAVEVAMDRMVQAMPHGRDYPDGTCREAREEMQRLLKQAQDIHASLQATALWINEQ